MESRLPAAQLAAGEPPGMRSATRRGQRERGEGGRLLSIAEAAEVMGTPERFVRASSRNVQITYPKIGNHVRITDADVQAFVLAGRVEPTRVRRRGGRVVA